jgi:hypothetical protein
MLLTGAQRQPMKQPFFDAFLIQTLPASYVDVDLARDVKNWISECRTMAWSNIDLFGFRKLCAIAEPGAALGWLIRLVVHSHGDRTAATKGLNGNVEIALVNNGLAKKAIAKLCVTKSGPQDQQTEENSTWLHRSRPC